MGKYKIDNCSSFLQSSSLFPSGNAMPRNPISSSTHQKWKDQFLTAARSVLEEKTRKNP
ncbi:MAG: hypothetical protein ACYCSO_04735 [Cuniculiplasma sp.]